MKYFVVADTHGVYTPFMSKLEELGYDINNDNHMIIFCGDIFDRGRENDKWYDFLDHNEGKYIWILGNHETFFNDVDNLRLNIVNINWTHNGFDKTLYQLFPEIIHGCKGSHLLTDSDLRRIRRTSKFKRIINLINKGVYYHELNDYIFTHAGIPFNASKDKWRSKMDEAATWGKTPFNIKMLGDMKKFTGKTLIVGHFHNAILRSVFENQEKNYNDIEQHKIYHNKIYNFIGLDGCVNYSSVYNILVLEE